MQISNKTFFYIFEFFEYMKTTDTTKLCSYRVMGILSVVVISEINRNWAGARGTILQTDSKQLWSKLWKLEDFPN